MRMRMMMIRLVMLRRRHRITTDLRVRFGLYEYIYYELRMGWEWRYICKSGRYSVVYTKRKRLGG